MVIDAVVPAGGPLAGDQTVTITGFNFMRSAGITSVTICGVSAVIQSITDNTITVKTGARGSGALGDVVVTKNATSVTAADMYFYTSYYFIADNTNKQLSLAAVAPTATAIRAVVAGAAGSGSAGGGTNGAGSYMFGRVQVTPGETLGIVCGNAGEYGGGVIVTNPSGGSGFASGGYSAVIHGTDLDANGMPLLNVPGCIAILAGGGGSLAYSSTSKSIAGNGGYPKGGRGLGEFPPNTNGSGGLRIQMEPAQVELVVCP